MSIKNRDIIVIGLQSWDIQIGSNCKNIAAELAKENRVLYVNMPIDRVTLLKNAKNKETLNRQAVLRGERSQFEYTETNLTVFTPKVIIESINWIKNKRLFDSLNRLNNKRIAAEINMAIEKLGFSDIILFNDNSMVKGYYMKEMLDASYFVYYIRDNLTVQPYFKKHGKRLEPQIMKQADLVVANSTYLAKYAEENNPNSHYIGQGCEFDLFDPKVNFENPLSNLNGPIVGYTGFLTEQRLSINLLRNLAQKLPNWNIVLVGPEDEAFATSDLHHYPNIHFMGPKLPSELPQYIKAFDVCINPQVVNELTIGNYPRKIDEYLAMGKPVVATETLAMQVFNQYVSLANNADEYVEAIEKAYREKDPQMKKQRRNFALSHTWENSVKSLTELI